jgi:exopolyphosphatase/guanosine-5'-triphosphate,3'-diphosphate pyrophosphatase
MTRRVASIDFGTNTARLLIADLAPDGSFEQVRIAREIVRMGGGFDRTRGLSPEAVDRGLSCLERFARILDGYDITRLATAATSAVRDAANGTDFTELVSRRTGIKLDVIDGEREGALTLAGVLAGLPQRPDKLLVFDVGGGSTEYTVAVDGRPCFISSLPLGVVRLTEGKESPDAMAEKIDRELERLVTDMERSALPAIDGETVLVGTAGTATTLAAISMEMATYDYRRVHNSVLERDEIRRIYDLLLPLTPDERLQVPGLEKGREDLIVAGCLITLHTMERFGLQRFTVSDYGLLEGLIVAGGIPP